jgi:uncharacterized protein YjcR
MLERDKAKKDWQRGMKQKQIAEKYGVSVNTVKSWITRHWKEKEGAPAKKKEVHPPRTRGAPIGNKNAVGNSGGAPLGNKNNFKHGLYAEIYFDTLTEEERAMIDAMHFDDVETYLLQQIQLLSVRERRLLHSIQKYNEAKGGLTLESVVQRKLEIKGNVIVDNKQNQTETTTRTVSTFEVIDKLEAKLTQVQRVKGFYLSLLHKLRQEGGGEGNGNMDMLVSTIEAARKKWGDGDD